MASETRYGEGVQETPFMEMRRCHTCGRELTSEWHGVWFSPHGAESGYPLCWPCAVAHDPMLPAMLVKAERYFALQEGRVPDGR